MAKIVIDGITYEVNPNNNLLQECLSQGLDLPYFCWHPCMGSVGACRQCAVKQYRDEDDDKGSLVMACMTPAADGSIISLEDSEAKTFRAQVIESLMISHPHDCPVCEEGGECHLQDMTLMSGHNYRRYDKKKVTHRNQYLGPFINHEMNRCITCYRCVRFYDDYAGGTDLSAQASHHHVYFGRHEEGVLESEFSGNLVEVCPTGVFTDKTFSEHYARKWDLQTAPSVCIGCAVGCNTTPGERYGSLRRIVNRYNSEINGYFLCDRGRFGYDFVNSTSRLGVPVSNIDETCQEIDDSAVATLITELKQGRTIGIGSPRASNEANSQLLTFVGPENFYAGVTEAEYEIAKLTTDILRDQAFHCPSVKEIESADAVLILGEDVTNVAPLIALALRQAVRNRAIDLATDAKIPVWQDSAVRELAQQEKSPLAILSSYASRLDDIASDVHIDSVERLVMLGSAVAHELDSSVDFSDELSGDEKEMVSRVAGQLRAAKRPLILSGSSNSSLGLVQAAANIARALQKASADGETTAVDLCLLVPEVNTLGLSLLTQASNQENHHLSSAMAAFDSGEIDNVIVLENDLFRRLPQQLLETSLSRLSKVVVVDQVETRTSQMATHVLPSTSFSEHEASYVNYEGRAQLSFQVHQNSGRAKPAWRWFCDDESEDSPPATVETVIVNLSTSYAEFGSLASLIPDRDQFGKVMGGMKIPRQTHRYSGRTAMHADVAVHEAKQPVDSESIMAFSMEGVSPLKDSTILASSWAPKWNSNQSISKFQDEVNGELKQGNTGIHLIARTASDNGYFQCASNIAELEADNLRLIPAFQIFGSDELSARADAIQQRMTKAYISLSPEDAAARGISQGDQVALVGNAGNEQQQSFEVIVCIRNKIKSGTAVLYTGPDGFCQAELGDQVRVTKVESADGSENAALTSLIVSDLYEEAY